MSGIARWNRDIRCDGCGKESTLFAESVAAARKKMRSGGWRTYKKHNRIYDKCGDCKPPQGEGWRIVS